MTFDKATIILLAGNNNIAGKLRGFAHGIIIIKYTNLYTNPTVAYLIMYL